MYFSFDKYYVFISYWCSLSEYFHSRDLLQNLLSIFTITVSEPSATVALDPCPGWERRAGEWRQASTAESHTRVTADRESHVLGRSIMNPLVNRRWLEACFTVLYQDLGILLIISLGWSYIVLWDPFPPDPLLVGNKFLFGCISRDDVGCWPLSGQVFCLYSFFFFRPGIGCMGMQVGVFLSDMREGKSLQFKVREVVQPECQL